MKHSRIYAFNGRPQDIEYVINLGAGATGTWHFPMECFVALAGVSDEILQKSTFHITSKSSYITSWLKLLHIPDERITDSPFVNAKTLYVPEMGRCGETFPTQIQWLRKIVNLPMDSVSGNMISNHTHGNGQKKKLTMLLIHRSGSRQIRNSREIP